jgi:hypothetical protein
VVIASVIGIVVSSPASPVGDDLRGLLEGVDFIAIATPILALVGLSIGKDRAVIRQLSWRVGVVALMSFSSTFLAAAAIAELFI